MGCLGALAPWSRSSRAKSAARRSMLAGTLALACAFLIQSAPAQATTITLTPEADAWVSNEAPDDNHGSDASLQIGGHSSTADRRTFLQFSDKGVIPPAAVVTRTTLRLYFESAPPGGYELRLTNPPNWPWGEGTITWNTPPPSITGPVSGDTTVITQGWNSVSVPFLTPGRPLNYVLTRPGTATSIQSREAVNAPELLVEYVVPDPTPTSVCSSIGCIESTPWAATPATASWAITVADFNGDGRDDHFVGRHGDQDRIYLQQPDGSFTPGFQPPANDRHGCAAGDVNADNRTDLYCMVGADGGEGLGRKSNELWIAQPGGTTFVNEAATWGVTDTNGRGRRPLLFDFSHDGKPDLYITNHMPGPGGATGNKLLINLGGRFEERVVAATGDFGSVCVDDGDWDRDGSNFRDLLVCGTEVNLFHNSGPPNFETEPRNFLLGSPLFFPVDAKLSDVNRDGWDDLVVVTRTELQIRLNGGPGNPNPRFPVTHTKPLVDGASVSVGDLTADGFPDIYVVEGAESGPDGPKNAPDKLFTGPNWSPLAIPQTDIGTGDESEFINVGGRQTLIVTNGRFFSRGPVQFIGFRPPVVTPPPGPPGVPPVPPAPPPPPVGTSKKLSKLPKAADVVRLPASRSCGRRASIRLRIRPAAGVKFTSAAVLVNGKRVKTVKQSKLTAPIKLGNLPRRKLTIKVVVKTGDGRQLSRSRKYRACGKKRGV